MEAVRYAGIILYRIQRSTEFLLLNDSYSNKRHWGPPKGKVIGTEDEVKCAIRETVDITGLSAKSINIADPALFRVEIKYLSGTTPKHVIYYIASISSRERIIPSGLAGFNMAWLPLQQAIDKAQYKSMQDILRQAAVFIEEQRSRAPAFPSSHMSAISGSSVSSNGGGRIGSAGGRETKDRDAGSGRDRRGGRNGDGTRGGKSSGVAGDGEAVAGGGGDRLKRGARAAPATGGAGDHLVTARGKAGGKDAATEGATKAKLVFAPNGSKNWRSGAAVDEGAAADAAAADVAEKSSAPAGGKADSADNPLYKTRLCERFETEGVCPYGPRCTFAHGTPELRDRSSAGADADSKATEGPENPLYKTRLCDRFLKENFCQYGPRCNFAHAAEELRVRPAAVPAPTFHDGAIVADAEKPAPPAGTNGSVGSSTTEVLHGRAVPAVVVGSKASKNGKKNDSISLKDLMSDRDKVAREKNPKIVQVHGDYLNPQIGDSLAPPGSTDKAVDSDSRSNGYSSDENGHAQQPLSAGEGEVIRAHPSYPAHQNGKASQMSKLEESLITELKKYFISSAQRDPGSPGGGMSARSLSEETKEITRLEFKHDLTKQQLFNVLVPSLFDEEYSPAKLQARLKFFQQFIRTPNDQTFFLRSWDKAMLRCAGLLKKGSLVFKNLYDRDLVDEDTFIAWYQSANISEPVKKKCEPLVEWLKNAEEEDE